MAVDEAKKKITEWKTLNPDEAAQIEKKHRLRLESERPDMWAKARNAMITAAVNMEIREIINN